MAETPDRTWFAPDRATLGDRIEAAREGAGLTQQEFAARLGVRLRSVQDWENDRAEPRANRLQMMAGMLGCSLRWLMAGEGPGGPEGPVTLGPVPPEARVALEALQGISAQMRVLSGELERIERELKPMLRAEVD